MNLKNKKLIILYTVIILSIAYFTYFRNYSYPERLVWDEHYYITGANKFLNNVMYFQSHPPLGKMIIALGEYLLGPNRDKQWFEFNLKIVNELGEEIGSKKKIDLLKKLIGKELLRDDLREILEKENFTEEEIKIVFRKAKEINPVYVLVRDSIHGMPAGYSFAGLRFFPALLAALSSLTFLYILLFISKNPHLSFLWSFFYLFDNAMIVHCRGAMLDGSQIFFILLAILYFIYTVQKKADVRITDYFILGLIISAGLSVKINTSILFLLFIFLLIEDLCKKPRKIYSFSFLKEFLIKVQISITGIALIFLVVFYIHCASGTKVLFDTYYSASDTYKKIIEHKQTGNLRYFPIMLRDNWVHMMNDLKGVPPPNYDNPNECASPAIYWPLGKKGINYCERRDKDTIRRIYLQGNFIVWYGALIFVIAGFIIILRQAILRKTLKNSKIFRLIIYFFSLYISYMAVMLTLKRAMYLYNYLIPLLFALILGFLIFNYIFEEPIKKNNKYIYIALGTVCIITVAVYWYYYPVTYYEPISIDEMKARIWADIEY